MADTRTIPPAVRAVQAEASDPAVSAWVSANAGAGKTHVLAQRVIRLLLSGVDPAKILCITFTKAAAANMANRVFDTLSAWTALDDVALDDAIRSVGSAKVDAASRARARRLFATALETPGGLKVQTIHAFCTRLLHQFPFEANVAARFTVLDGTAEAQLLDQLMLEVLLEGAAAPDGALGQALRRAITFAADQTFKEVVKEAVGKRRELRTWLDAAGGIEAAMAELSAALGIDPGDTVESVEAQVFDNSIIAEAEWQSIAAALAEGSKRDGEQSDRFRRLAAAPAGSRLDTYVSVFCTGKLKPRTDIVTKAIQRNHPDLFSRLCAEQERICALLDRRRAVTARERTAALVTIADTVVKRYAHEKDRRGLLDYDDLIEKTLSLLDSAGAAWVLYKLDLGIDHILIDEAQDTSPPQWRIVEKLASEFTAGAGARSVTRTLFAVGDDKQSIFSFQGAAPQMFAEMRRHFGRHFRDAGQDWREVKFQVSFRSGSSVLGAVDIVYARPEAHAGLSADPVATVHEALPDAAPGEVEIWETIKPDDGRDVTPWDAPFDTARETSPQVKLAAKIAATIAAWRQAGRRPSEVLILVRQRGQLFETIIRALKDCGIAVAGADRLVLTTHIAVMDLMVLADALLLAQDDLALATVLRSPLFGFSDEQLFALAWNRTGTLAEALRAKAAEDSAFAAAQTKLDRLAVLARQQTPFAFYAQVLGAMGGRRQFIARLGPEASDALDEFLNLALDFESRETPSLQGFVAWLRSANAEIKRDMEITRDQVRVMTVHGAKGLEAPIVILADTTTKPGGPRDPRLLAVPADGAAPGTPDRLVWAGATAEDVPAIADARSRARQAAQDEYRRLLYVAMTRAAERLIICGIDGTRKRPDGCWYDLVHDALAPALTEETADDGNGTVLRYRKPEGLARNAPAVVNDGAETGQPEPEAAELPNWLKREAPPADTIIPLTPSRALEPARPLHGSPLPLSRRPTAEGGREGGETLALARGRLVHRLLQALPDLPEPGRVAAARRFMEKNARDFNTAEQESILADVQAVLEAPQFAALFRSGSRGEVPIVGRIATAKGLRPVSGQVDRLVVTAGEVLIADYKTDRPAPQTPPPAYVAQLALYRAVLARLYPGRAVRAALLWTEGPELAEIPAAELDRALAEIVAQSAQLDAAQPRS